MAKSAAPAIHIGIREKDCAARRAKGLSQRLPQRFIAREQTAWTPRSPLEN